MRDAKPSKKRLIVFGDSFSDVGDDRGLVNLLGSDNVNTLVPPYNGRAASDNLTYAQAFGIAAGFDF